VSLTLDCNAVKWLVELLFAER